MQPDVNINIVTKDDNRDILKSKELRLQRLFQKQMYDPSQQTSWNFYFLDNKYADIQTLAHI